MGDVSGDEHSRWTMAEQEIWCGAVVLEGDGRWQGGEGENKDDCCHDMEPPELRDREELERIGTWK